MDCQKESYSDMIERQQKEEQNRLRQEYASTVHDLSELGWDLSEDEDLQDLQYTMMGMMGEEIKMYARNAVVQKNNQGDFLDRKALWEEDIPEQERRETRMEFLGSCSRVGATAEFIQDSKERWEKGHFTSVSKYLVIGDTFVKKPLKAKLADKDELDIGGYSASIGRLDMTYSRWEEFLQKEHLPSLRPKINGERFVMVKEGNRSFLRGFKELEIIAHPNIELVEYYAGQYYVLSPILASAVECVTLEEGKRKSVIFNPHPFCTPADFMPISAKIYSHKYDGLMCWDGQQEIRLKFDPTTEVKVNGEVWEVRLAGDDLFPVRPRPGKQAFQASTAISQIRSRARLKYLLPYFEKQVKRPLEKELQRVDKDLRCGAKILFFSRTGKIFLIREPDKGLDCIGGQSFFGESAEDTAVREMWEETGVKISGRDLIFLGTSEEKLDTCVWRSSVFVALAPSNLGSCKYVEEYLPTTFDSFVRSSIGRPRQKWLARHFDYIGQMFRTVSELNSYHALYFPDSPPALTVPMTTKVAYLIFNLYNNRRQIGHTEESLSRLIKLRGLPEIPKDFPKNEWEKEEERSRQNYHEKKNKVTRNSTPEEMKMLLLHIFVPDSMLFAKEAKERYLKIQYNSDRSIARFFTDCVKLNLLCELPAIDARGRRLELQLEFQNCLPFIAMNGKGSMQM